MNNLNPEFERNLWLEFSRHRLIAAPVLFLLAYYLLSNIGFRGTTMADIMMTGYLAIIFLWGGHKAAEAVLEEVNDNTWDFQRLSSQSPWALSWAKLFGSTSYVWYTASIFLGLYICSVWNLPDDYPYSVPMSGLQIAFDVFSMIIAALVCHSVALLSSLQAAQDASSSRAKVRIINHHVLGIIVGMYCSSFMRPHNMGEMSLDWYGDNYNSYKFSVCMSFLFFLWVLFGIYWQMRAQLRVRSGPLPWMAFVIYCMAVMAGFDFNFMGTHLGTYFAFLFGLLLYYFMLGVESWTGIRYRQIFDNWRGRNLKEIIYLFPRWVLTYLLTVAAAALFILMNASSSPQLSWSAVAILCFALRDAGILHLFRLGTSSRRPQSAALIYLIVLYGLIPWLLRSLSLPTLAHLFWPLPLWRDESDMLVVSAVSGLVQAAIVWRAVRGNWRKYWQAF